MIVYNDNYYDSNKYKSESSKKQKIIIKRNVRPRRRKKSIKISKQNQKFLRALGFKL